MSQASRFMVYLTLTSQCSCCSVTSLFTVFSCFLLAREKLSNTIFLPHVCFLFLWIGEGWQIFKPKLNPESEGALFLDPARGPIGLRFGVGSHVQVLIFLLCFFLYQKCQIFFQKVFSPCLQLIGFLKLGSDFWIFAWSSWYTSIYQDISVCTSTPVYIRPSGVGNAPGPALAPGGPSQRMAGVRTCPAAVCSPAERRRPAGRSTAPAVGW